MTEMPIGDRLRHILERLAHHNADHSMSFGDALCATSVEVLEVAGAGITLHGDPALPFSIGIAGPDMAAIHDLERTLGEGPCIDAFRSGTPSWSPDLSDPTDERWPAFRAEALRTRARAAFGYPLRAVDSPFGALNLYATRAGQLTDGQHHDATLLASLSSHVVLADVAGGPTPASADIEDAVRNEDKVHQATGMVSVQLAVSIADALAHLRARAFAEGRTIADVASDVVSRRLRFER